MKLSKILSIVAGSALLLGACDDVKEADRYIELDAVESDRNVLLVDFTGQNCINCPSAHEAIEALEEQYNADGEHHLIAVAVHCGRSLGLPTSATNFDMDPPRIGLLTREGENLMQAFGISTQPRGIIDLTGASLDYNDWAGAVRNAMEKPTHVNLTAKAVFTPAANETYGAANGISGNIKITLDILAREQYTDTKVQFWIVEDNITAMQKFPEGSIKNDYVHNNVFRAQLFDGNGEDIALTENTTVTAEGSIDARFTNKERWMLKNLAVVAYVMDNSGVLQAVRVPVTLPDGYEQPEA